MKWLLIIFGAPLAVWSVWTLSRALPVARSYYAGLKFLGIERPRILPIHVVVIGVSSAGLMIGTGMLWLGLR